MNLECAKNRLKSCILLEKCATDACLESYRICSAYREPTVWLGDIGDVVVMLRGQIIGLYEELPLLGLPL